MSINTNRSSPTQINTSTNNYAMIPTQVGLHWSQISIGPSHTIAIATDGTLWGWGYNNVGQVGNSSLINQSSPVQIASGSWTHVHADMNYSLALRVDDLLFGWGYNQYGQLGSNIPVGDYRSSPVQINSTSWSTVSSGTNHVVAIKSDSTLWAWGFNNAGQLGNGSYNNTSSPVQIGTSSYTQVVAGNNYTTALTTDNKVVTFGNNTYGQLGYDVSSTIQSWTMIASNDEYTLAIRNDGLLFGWGINTTGQLGTNDTLTRSSPTQIGTNSWAFVSVNGGSGGAAPAAIRSDGTLWSWGNNNIGQVGDATTINRSSPVQVSVGGSWSIVSASQSHKLAVTSTGLLYGWGFNSTGQLGQNDIISRSAPIQITTGLSFISIGASLTSSYAITNIGGLYAWGAGTNGRLGLNDTLNRSSPVQVGSSSWTSVYSTSDGAVYAVKSNNKLYVWGFNYGVNGSLGTNDTVSRSSPVQIHSNDWKTSVNSLAGISSRDTFGIQSNNSLWAWGLATIALASDFATATFTYSWTQISAGDSHTVGIRSDGRLYAWGKNDVGQLGTNDVILRSSPTQIGTSQNEGEFWYSVSARGSRTVAIRSDSTLWVWGLNSGYVGLSDSINRSSPVQISTAPVASYTQISAGIDHTLAITNTGQLYTWGSSNAYQNGYNSLTITPTLLNYLDTTAYSTTFNGSTDYITISGTPGAFGTNAFTVECWIYFTGASQVGEYDIIDSTGGSFQLYFANPSNGIKWGKFGTTGIGPLIAAGSVPISTWTHLAVTRTGTGANQAYYFVNGILIGTTTDSNNYSGSGCTIGGRSGGSNYFTGNISNVRMINGTALYTSNFTPSTSPLTTTSQGATASQVSLLTCQTGIPADGSNNNFSITISGSAAGSPITPFISSLSAIGSGSFTQIAAGNSHSLAVDTNSKLFVWGDNTVGQAGTSSSLKYWTNVHIGTFSTTAYAIRNDGALYSWGSDSSGNFGTNNAAATQRSSPVQIGSSSWSMIAAGRSHTLAIKADGTLWAWGANASGELADAVPVGGARSSPVQLGTSSWSFIAAGYASSAGIDITGKLYTWGINTSGLLGTSDTLNRSNVTQIGTPSSWTQVGFTKDNAGSTFAIRSDGSLFTWGPGALGILGDNATLTRSSPVQVHTGIKYISMSGGPNAMYGIRDDYTLWSWGFNNVGQLGDNTTVNKSSPIQVAPGYVFEQVAGGTASAQGLTTGGLLFAWGSNANGQLGIGDTLNRSSPVQIGALSWEFISTGNTNVFGISRGGSPTLPNLYAWGDPITSGTTPGRSSPVQVQSFILNQFVSSPTQLGTSSWTSISAGASYSLGVNSTGLLYAWGSNSDGQIPATKSATAVNTENSVGDGYIRTIDNHLLLWGYGIAGQLGDNQAVANKSTPVNVTKLIGVTFKDFAQVKSSVSGYTLAISTDNKLWAWGANNSQALGTGNAIFRSMPVQIGNSSWTSVAVGLNYTIALKSDNTLWGWGSGYPAAGAVSWRAVSAGASHTLILRSDKQLFGFGSNTAGQLGDLTVVAKSSPTVLHAGSLYNSIAAGTNISAGIREDNTLWTWGINTNGALGLGDTLNRSSPTQVRSLTNDFWSQVTASDYMLAQSNTFGIYGWGLNTGGQLGNNTTVSRSSPVQLPFAGSIYSNYGSVLFNNSTSYFTMPTTSNPLDWGTSANYTIEAWVYPNAFTATESINILARRTATATTTDWQFQIGTTGLLSLYNFNGGPSVTVIATKPATLNQWNHCAVVITNGSAAIYLNGTKVSTDTAMPASNNNQASTYVVGASNNVYFNGYISNVRVVNGTAVYTGTFTVPTSPLETTQSSGTNISAITAGQTKLLTAQSNSFIDNSSSALTLTPVGTVGLSGLNPFSVPSGVNNSIVDLSAGTASYIINYDNKLYVWGINNAGQLGLSDTVNRSSPVQVGTSSFTQVSAGSSYALAICSDNTLWSWGLNNIGQIATNDLINRSSPVQVSGSWTFVAAGNSFSSAIKSDSTIWTWGNNATGQLGINGNISKSFLMLNGTHSAILTDNTLWIWGGNDSGQLANNTVINRSSPVQLAGSWTAVSGGSGSGGAFAVGGIRTDGTLWTWGSNANGKLGDNTAVTFRSSPVQVGTDTDWSTITGKRGNLFALKTNGTLWGWGQGTYVGDNTSINRSSPVQIAGSWLSVSSNGFSTYAIKNDYTLWTWGLNLNGQLGVNDTLDRSSPVQVGTSSYSQVQAGASHVITLDITDRILVWGINTAGQLGLGNTTARSTPTQLGSLTWPGAKLAASTSGSAFIDGTGLLYTMGIGLSLGLTTTISRSSPVQVGSSSWTMISTTGNPGFAGVVANRLFTWGSNSNGALGDNTTVDKSSPVLTVSANLSNPVFTYSLSPVQVGTSSWSIVSAGGSQVVGLINDQPWQNLYTWGAGTLGLIGSNDTLNRSSPIQVGSTWLSATRSSPVQISGTSDWSIISAADSAAYAIKNNGTLWTWGAGTNGKLGLNDTINRSSPTQIGSSSWAAISGGRSFVAGITTDGTLYAWGQNSQGQLGQGDTVDRSNPTQITGSYTAVSSGESFIVAIKTGGITWAWGHNTSGQVGDTTVISRSSPVQVSTSVVFDTIFAGSATSYGIKNNSLYVWGGGGQGQFGDGGSTANRTSPVLAVNIWYNNDFTQSSPTQIGVSSSWSVVAAGPSTSMALGSTGLLWSWGTNTAGQVGDSSTNSRSSIVQIGTSSFSIITAGGINSYAIKPTTNLLFGWGAAGTLGDNTAVNRSSPVQVFTGTMVNPLIPIQLRSFVGSSITQVQSGSSVVTVTSSSGLLYAWGNSASGQLGIQNVSIVISSPVLIGGQSQSYNNTPLQVDSNSYTQISAGYRHVLAIRDNSTLYGWGNFAATAPVTSAYSWRKLASGQQHFLGLRADGTLWAWGNNSSGQLGTNDIISRSSPTQIGSGTYIDIAAGGSFSVAIKNNYSLYTWGRNVNGQLGQGGTDTIGRSSPTQVGSLSLSNSNAYSSVFDGTGDYLTVTGANLSIGTSAFTTEFWAYTTTYTVTTFHVMFDCRSSSGTDTAGYAVYFSATNLVLRLGGTSVNIAIASSNFNLNAWNHVAVVRLTTSDIRLYVNGTNVITYTGAAAAYNFTNTTYYIAGPGPFDLTYRWNGYLTNFRLVVGTALYTANFTVPTTPLTAISGTQLLTVQNTTFVDNSTNAYTVTAFGDSTPGIVFTPFTQYIVSTGGAFTSIAAGFNHVVGIATDGALYVWGLNATGQLGTNNVTQLYTPTKITSGVSYINVAAGGSASAAIDTNQNLYTWGFNIYGSLGIGDILNRSSPTQVGSNKYYKVIMSGTSNDTLHLLRTDNTLWSVGFGNLLGNNSTVSRSSPVQISAGSFWTDVVGAPHAVNTSVSIQAKKADGTLWTWGYNVNGRLGIGDTLDRSSPVQLGTAYTNGTPSTGGTSYASVLDATGQLFTMGLGTTGELGDYNILALQARSSPVQIGIYYPTSPVLISSDSWTQISAGNDLNLGVKTNDTLYAWGLNTSYQTGIGAGPLVVSSPTAIGTTISSVSAGSTAGGYIKNA